MDFTAAYLPSQWELAWRREKERRKRAMEEGGEMLVEEHRRMQWIKAYNDKKMALKKKEREEKEVKDKTESVDEDQAKEDKDQEKDQEKEKEKLETTYCKQESYPTEVFKSLEALRHFSVLTDLTLSVDGGHCLRAHSLVLAAVSTVVQEMLQKMKKDGEKWRSKRFLRLGPEVSRLGLCAVLEFAYTGSIDGLNRDSLAQVRTAAQSLGVPRVLELCREEAEEEEKKRQKYGENKAEDRKKLSAEEQVEVSLWSIQKLWEEGVGCDVELKAEGHAFRAHKILLVASSDYFHGMFISGMKESRQASVSLLLIRAPELEALIHCCYSGTLVLGWDCIFEITCRALQFQFQPALSLCFGFLWQHIDLDSCLDVAAFAEAYMIGDLLKATEDFVLQHFQEVADTPKFRDLPARKLQDLLGHNALSVSSELAVFRAVVTWIEADPEERLPLAQGLMARVRFPLMTFKEFREVRAVNLQMECSSDCSIELYGSALKEFGFGVSCPKPQHRIRYPKDALVLVGGDKLEDGLRVPSRELWFANSMRSGLGLVKEIEWRILGEMPEQARFRHGVSILDGKIYVAGGCHYYATANTMKSVYRYDPLNNSWERLADMLENRSSFAMVVRSGVLYAVGGDRDINTNLDTVEKYSPDKDTWSYAHPLDQPLSGQAATVWDGEIFLSGGFNCKYQCLVSMLLYHPERGTTYLADMAQDRALHCMEQLANRFYVAGGARNLNKFYTNQLACEFYNPVTDSWTTFTPLPQSHVGAASAVLEEKVYVLGGYCQENYTESKLVHRYDPVTERWESMGNLEGPVSDLRACVIRLPEELRKY